VAPSRAINQEVSAKNELEDRASLAVLTVCSSVCRVALVNNNSGKEEMDALDWSMDDEGEGVQRFTLHALRSRISSEHKNTLHTLGIPVFRWARRSKAPMM